MRYGLSLLVCFAMSICANAKAPVTQCTGNKCSRTSTEFVIPTEQKAAPVIAQGSCCGSAPARAQAQAPVRQVGPIRQFFRNVFRR